MTTVELFLAVAVLFVAPATLRLAARPAAGPASALFSTVGRLAPAAGAIAVAGILLPRGGPSAALTLPWLALTVFTAAIGVGRLVSRPLWRDPTISIDFGLIYLSVGAIWLVVSRWGANPLGFSDEIVELTAIHFHYAGLALPVVVGWVTSSLGRGPAVPMAIVVGVAATAAGITMGGTAEWLSATAMAGAGFAAAGTFARFGRRHDGTTGRLGLAAAVGLAAGMTMAIAWAWGRHFGWTTPGLDTMARVHGSLNALAVGGFGLVAAHRAADNRNIQRRVLLHLGRPTERHLERLRAEAAAHEPTNPTGLLDRSTPAGFTRRTWRSTLPHDDLQACRCAFEQWRGHAAAGLKVWPPGPPLAVGTTVAIAIPVGPVSVSATARIVRVIDEPDRFGFVYATLPHHPEDGEELFVVERTGDGELEVLVTAVWRQSAIANRLCPPLTAWLQNRAIERYLVGFSQPGTKSVPCAAGRAR